MIKGFEQLSLTVLNVSDFVFFITFFSNLVKKN